MDHVAIFEEQVSLTPRDLRGELTSIDTILEEKLRSRLEGRCSRHGYVRQGTLKLLSRTMGKIEKGRFTGNILYHVQAEAKVLNPPDGAVVTGEVIRKNKMGLYVNYEDAIRIIVPRDLNIGNEEFETVDVGEMITVEIKKSRFQVNDEYILSVGLFQGRKEPRAAAPATAPVEETLDEESKEADGEEAKEGEDVEASVASAETEEEEGKETE